jgi:hypothetical protein
MTQRYLWVPYEMCIGKYVLLSFKWQNLILRGQAFIYLHILQFRGLIMPFIFAGCRVEARSKHGIQYTQKVMPPSVGSLLAILFPVNELR